MNQHPYKDAAAANLIQLHDAYLRQFVASWREAQALETVLPVTSDPDYASREHLLLHVLGAARGYMVWMCDVLGLPDPEIDEVPALSEVESKLDEYVDRLLAGWQGPLCDVDSKRMHSGTYRSNWGVTYCIDAMLEHAVMHPIRHAHQLRTLMDSAASASRG